ncbi:MAG TPA: hypothetical protein VIO94_15915 [Phenylobacterium sp.]
MRITLHNRGGMSVFGQGFYDPHKGEAIVPAKENETRRVTIDWGATASSVTKAESGIASTEPTTDGAKTTATLSGMVDNGYVEFQATVDYEVRKVRIRARSDDTTDGYGC